MEEKELASSSAISYKGVNAIHEGHPVTSLPPKDQAFKHHQIGIRISTYVWDGEINFQSVVLFPSKFGNLNADV